MNCENCGQELNENYMICRNCGEPRKPLETWELRLWKNAQTEIEQLTAENDELLEKVMRVRKFAEDWRDFPGSIFSYRGLLAILEKEKE